jgi:multiple sugar transport system substrate-binding protein
MKHLQKKIICVFMILLLIFIPGCSIDRKKTTENITILDADHPVTIKVWHYYNGAQQDALNELVTEFNEGKGLKTGIKVEASSLGSVSDLEENVLASINGKVGAKELPNIFAAYADTAYTVDKLGMAVDLKDYMTDEELSEYVDSYINEGKFSSDDSLKIFPVAKATEIFMLNRTDWDKFSAATGSSLSDISTIEGVTSTAKKYYEWTDSLTEIPDDGKAFFGRDAMANYFIIGARQLGIEIFAVNDGTAKLNFDKEVVRRLWDNYYIPYINGYFASSGKFRSDDIKTGNILSFVGSSAGSTFFPDQVTLNDNLSYPIEMEALVCPRFEDSENIYVQQGAGMVVTKKESQAEIEASIEFLKWFTDTKQNINFSVTSGYLPVKKKANNRTLIGESLKDKNASILNVVDTSLKQIEKSNLYTTRAFQKGTDARNILEYALSDKAASDRELVVSEMQNGDTHETAVSQFTSDQNFDTWYQETKTALELLLENN